MRIVIVKLKFVLSLKIIFKYYPYSKHKLYKVRDLKMSSKVLRFVAFPAIQDTIFYFDYKHFQEENNVAGPANM